MNREDWIDLAIAACNHAGLACGPIEIIATWDQKYCANAVYNIGGGRYLKLFGPTAERQFHVECSVLHTLAEQNVIPAPRLVAEGERKSDRPYLVTMEIAGETAENVWEELTRTEQLTIARELGLLTAAIHRLPQADLAAVEQHFGGRNDYVKRMQPRRIADIKALERLSTEDRDSLIQFLQMEALAYFAGPSKLTHSELAHNHIYLSRETGALKVSGLLDWADAMLGLPEWDLGYLWFWTFSRDREAMRNCLQTFYADNVPPERLARRCFAATLYTSSMSLLWPYFVEHIDSSGSIVREMIQFYFPPDIFGSPD